MKDLNLKKLLKKKALTDLLVDLATLADRGITFALCDIQGEPLVGSTALSAEEVQAALRVLDEESAPVASWTASSMRALVVEGEAVGILLATPTCPSAQLDIVADLMILMITQALESRSLAQETLERYREINLLYNIQEAIGAPLDAGQIASLVVRESVRVIKATAGALLFLAPDQLTFNVQARHGETPVEKRCSHADTIAGWVVRNRRAAIVNEVSTDPRCGPADAGVRSLLCVPLIVSDRNVNALVLYDKVNHIESPANDGIFTASDQKLLTALASQAAIAIKTAREVEARESRLRAKIRELRIEIDEMRKRRHVTSITTTDYFARLQQSAQEMRREFEQGL